LEGKKSQKNQCCAVFPILTVTSSSHLFEKFCRIKEPGGFKNVGGFLGKKFTTNSPPVLGFSKEYSKEAAGNKSAN
jgi:hypothetical protein